MYVSNAAIELLRSVKDMFPVEQALTLGVVFFCLSWLIPRRLITLPSSGQRAVSLTGISVVGSFSVLAVAAVASGLSYLYAFPDPSGYGGWWRRAAPLAAVVLVLVGACFALRRTPLATPSERLITPRRHWWAFSNPVQLWLTFGVATVLMLSVLWQIIIGVSAPADANRYGNVPEPTDLPIYMPMQGDMGYVAGAGWPNHLATVLVIMATFFVLAFALGADANRPLCTRSSASQVREERVSTARVLVWLVLGGLLLTLGAVWAHIGFIGDIIVGVDESTAQGEPPQRFYVGTGYRDLAALMHKGGYVIQGIGAALLLRLLVDAFRAFRVFRSAQGNQLTNEPVPTVTVSEQARTDR